MNSFKLIRLQSLGAAGPSAINRSLLPHEQQVISIRQHPAVLIGTSVLAVTGLLAALILTAILFSNGGLVLIVWIAWLMLFVRLIWKTANWLGNYFVVTSERMLLATGVFTREVAMIPLWSVTDLSFSRSLGGRWFGYGEFIVEYIGGRDLLLNSIEYIPDPERLYLRICEIIFEPEEKEEIEEILCPVCNSDGSIFRRENEKAGIRDHMTDHRLADSPGQAKDDLLARGYVEVTCPACGGEGTVRTQSHT